jgi:hypothetical protein
MQRVKRCSSSSLFVGLAIAVLGLLVASTYAYRVRVRVHG